ncbi:nitrate/nitrite transporter [Streptomyces sp. NPDC001381]|uniref:MFS transporter n=1 Tax=Streptomyces sp. NPDC001381 TaxID=3364567 RepID=UPI0036757A68
MTTPTRDGAPPKNSWKQYVADFVKAPRQAKAALMGSLLLVAISPSALSALTPYVAPAYAMKTGTTPSDAILLFVTVPLVIGPLLLPVVGRWVDRQGARRVAIPAVILYAITTAAVPLAAGRTWLLETLLILAAICGFAASLGVVFKVISTWFPEHRGIGFGFVGVTSSLAGAVLSPVFQWLVNGDAPAVPSGGSPSTAPPSGKPPVSAADPGVFTGLGWDGVYYVVATAIAVIGIPAVLWLISEPKVTVPAGPKLLEADLPGVPFRRAVRTRAWIFIVLLLTFVSTGPVSVRQNAVDLFGQSGIDAATVSLGLSVLFSASVVGLLVAGTVLDRARHPWIVAVLIATVPVGLALALINGGSLALFYVAMALLGFATGAESALGPALIAKYLGLKSFGSMQGLTLAITGSALALAPYAVSAIQASSGSYTPPLLMLVGLTGIGVVLAALLPKYPRPWVMQTPAEDDVPRQPTVAS